MDSNYLNIVMQYAVRCANNVPGLHTPFSPKLAHFILSRYMVNLDLYIYIYIFVLIILKFYRYSGLEMTMFYEFLVASLLSSQGHTEIKRLNPFLNDFEVKRVFDLVVCDCNPT